MPPTVQYFQLRGRGEALKVALALKGVDFDAPEVDYAKMKADLVTFTFGQVPRYSDEDVPTLCQSNAIIRHIGRKYGMYGEGLLEAALIDQILEGVEAIRVKYVNLIYQDKLEDAAKATYMQTHIDPNTVAQRNGGAHLTYLAKLLEANNGGNGFVVGSAASIADAAVFDIVDLHMRIFEQEMKAQQPLLVAYHARIAAIPSLKAYLDSDKRLSRVNGNDLG